jgi:plastocyanin
MAPRSFRRFRPISIGPSKESGKFALVCALAVSFLVAASSIESVAAAQPTTHTVVIDGVKYEPETVTVKRGDTVIWVNKDPFPHTVTAGGVFDSREIPAGKAWKYTARKTGEYAYICTLHPNMKGTLKVE